ncbi:ATP-binding protein [Patescibacteria group bacterium]|nr:ATP-binding protein [Patescibacteria group bacterium]MBU4017311.1 ATP-binding protein [Patescibacteria group bacterium]MBU4099271.1 ATP-binding protein [Patescibacteria group bacterium]
MEIERIKKVIVDQKEELEEFFKTEKIIQRELDMEKLRKFLAYPNVLVITGPRRSGKSTLAMMLFDGEKFGYLNFDDERLAGFSAGDFNTALLAFYDLYGQDIKCFVFDEIQNISGWELFINRLRRTKKIVITGSNANLLSGDLATHLTGRYLEAVLYPFSFREFLKAKEAAIEKEDFYSTKKISLINKYLNEYLKIGGFPETLRFGQVIAGKIYEDVITKDILLRYGIKNKNSFREMSNYLISNFSSKINYAKIGRAFFIKNVHTVRNYADYLSSSFLVIIVEKFSYKKKLQFSTSKKIYGIDTGLVNSIAFQISSNEGRIMENAVLLDLKRRGDYGDDKFEVYYWSDYLGKEVDFAVKKGKRIIQLIQVCQSLQNIETKEREIKSLLKASRELQCDNLLIITASEEAVEKIEGKEISIIPLWKWLMSGLA